MFPGNPNGPLLALELDAFIEHCLLGHFPQECCTILGVANLIALRKRGAPTHGEAELSDEQEAIKTIAQWCDSESRQSSLWDVDDEDMESTTTPFIRPIAAGEVLRRLVGKVACALTETTQASRKL